MNNLFNTDFLYSDAELKPFRDACFPFNVFRGNILIGKIYAVHCSNDYKDSLQSIRLNSEPVVPIKPGDILVQEINEEKFIVESLRPIDPSYHECIIKYKTNNSSDSGTTFNISTVSGNSVIGNQNTVNINQSCTLEDISKLLESLNISSSESEELIQALKKLENTDSTVPVRGILAKFSDLMNKHHELIVAIGGWAVELMKAK